MKSSIKLAALGSLSACLALSSCSLQEEIPAKLVAAPAGQSPAAKADAPADKAPAKAKAEKARGDVGLLDTEKNYLILVTNEGKLIALDFDEKTRVTQITPTETKVEDIVPGSSATVTYTTQKKKNIASALEYTPAKGGD